MIQYAVVAFPRSDGLEAIEKLRRRFDPQASLLPAHITLAFPFATAMSVEEMQSHLETAVRGLTPFDVVLGDPSPAEGEYVFLNVLDGAEVIQGLHGRVYAGTLAAYKSPTQAYRPHMTLGRIRDSDALRFAVGAARSVLPNGIRGTIAGVSLFRLESATQGSVVLTIPFAGPAR